MNKDLNDVAKRITAVELLFYKNRIKVLGLCFDFMTVVDLPKLPVQKVYYYRQLSVNTFGIHNLNMNNLFYYVYHETAVRKTPNDVCSFLIYYSFVGDYVEEFHLFCDNCTEQNKDHA
jgi:hypothetical protein